MFHFPLYKMNDILKMEGHSTEHLSDLKVMVFDRSWNRDHKLPGANFKRCTGWDEIKKEIEDNAPRG